MIPKNRIDQNKYFEKCEAESKRILGRFNITSPRCGFGIGLGWMPVVERALEKMVAAGWDRDLQQVKQKFGGLRIYIGVGHFDNIDNPVKRFFRKPIEWLASRNFLPFKKDAGIFRAVLSRLVTRTRIFLWWLSRTWILAATKPSLISQAIQEAEDECDALCEVCGREREKKGICVGWALCNDCGQEKEEE